MARCAGSTTTKGNRDSNQFHGLPEAKRDIVRLAPQVQVLLSALSLLTADFLPFSLVTALAC